MSSNPFQYTGRENDGTGVYYYRARYYSPTLQRFISEDLLSFQVLQIMRQQPTTSELAHALWWIRIRHQDFNPYIYVYNSPLGYVDPFGFAGVGLTPIKGIIAGGPGELIGGITLGIIGAGVGASVGGIPGAIVGGIIGGQIGGALGSLADPACAGQLNCGEDDMLPSPPPPPPPPCGRKC